jgi:hypothetical protein
MDLLPGTGGVNVRRGNDTSHLLLEVSTVQRELNLEQSWIPDSLTTSKRTHLAATEISTLFFDDVKRSYR